MSGLGHGVPYFHYKVCFPWRMRSCMVLVNDYSHSTRRIFFSQSVSDLAEQKKITCNRKTVSNQLSISWWWIWNTYNTLKGMKDLATCLDRLVSLALKVMMIPWWRRKKSCNCQIDAASRANTNLLVFKYIQI